MKKCITLVTVLTLVLTVLLSSLIIVSAETIEAKSDSDDNKSVTIIEDDGGRAYELVWRFMSYDGHMWKRRWNKTLGEWYDPDWILVY